MYYDDAGGKSLKLKCVSHFHCTSVLVASDSLPRWSGAAEANDHARAPADGARASRAGSGRPSGPIKSALQSAARTPAGRGVRGRGRTACPAADDEPASSHAVVVQRRLPERTRQVELAVTITSAMSSRATAGAARALARPGDPGRGNDASDLADGWIRRRSLPGQGRRLPPREDELAGRARKVPDHHGRGGTDGILVHRPAWTVSHLPSGPWSGFWP